MYIELHMIQNFAPSNLNRDETNNPKDCEFGGVRRARISSQAIKRAIRTNYEFYKATQVDNAVRTRYLAKKLEGILVERGKEQAAVEEAVAAFAEKFISKLDDKGRTNVLVYLSPLEINSMIDLLEKNWDEVVAGVFNFDKSVKAWVKQAQGHTNAPDIAMFGRMLANEPSLNLDAACQVAHAISTHRVNMEMDFFTAVDDLQSKEETGSGMMGITAFNSACFYRYHRIDWGQLVENLDGNEELAKKSMEGFLRSALVAIPSGKQNSFAAQNPPSFALAVVRKDGQAWSLANAFEKPVYPGREIGLVGSSLEALDTYWGKLKKVYGDGKEIAPFSLCLVEDVDLSNLAGSEEENAEGWISAVLEKLTAE